MKIGIDISQCVYEGTGVGKYTTCLVERLISMDKENHYILFYAHARRRLSDIEVKKFKRSNTTIRQFRIPIPLLEFFWNRLHIIPIEWLIGPVDIFLTSDWLEPPTVHAKKITTIHDLSVLRFPHTFDKKIRFVHKRKLALVAKESDVILCDSLSTLQDAQKLLHIKKERLRIVYPGIC